MRLRFVLVLLGGLLVAAGGGLALGSAVRSGPASQPTLTAIGDEQARSEQLQRLLEEASAAQRLVTDMAALLLDARLADQSVLLVTTPGGAAEARQVQAMLRAAGASIAGELDLTDRFTDVRHGDELLDLIVASLPPNLSGDLPVTADGVGATGALLGAVLFRQEPAVPVGDVRRVLSALESHDFLTGDSGIPAPADAVVLLTGGTSGEAGLLSFVDALRDAGPGAPVVVAGTSGERGTLVSALRGDAELTAAVSTVDDVATPQGRLVTAWAVADLFDGRVGHYGTAPGAEALPDLGRQPGHVP